MSTKEKDFSVLSEDNIYDIRCIHKKAFKFRDSSMFKELYRDKEICNSFYININTEKNLMIFKEYLKRFNQEKYDFIKELGGEQYE